MAFKLLLFLIESCPRVLKREEELQFKPTYKDGFTVPIVKLDYHHTKCEEGWVGLIVN